MSPHFEIEKISKADAFEILSAYQAPMHCGMEAKRLYACS
jgi:hypothetical protein